MLVPAGEILAFAAHRAGLGANHLHAHWPTDDLADFQHRWLERLALFGDERRIGRYSVQHSQSRRLAYFVNISCIQKDFHSSCPSDLLRQLFFSCSERSEESVRSAKTRYACNIACMFPLCSRSLP